MGAVPVAWWVAYPVEFRPAGSSGIVQGHFHRSCFMELAVLDTPKRLLAQGVSSH